MEISELGERKNDFQDLNIWKRAREIRLKIEEIVKTLPGEEKYSLGDQMIRSSRSITALIAEGWGRYHYKENIQFCRQARGSLFELIDHLVVAIDNSYIEHPVFLELEAKIKIEIKEINGYIKYLSNQKSKGEDNK